MATPLVYRTDTGAAIDSATGATVWVATNKSWTPGLADPTAPHVIGLEAAHTAAALRVERLVQPPAVVGPQLAAHHGAPDHDGDDEGHLARTHLPRTQGQHVAIFFSRKRFDLG